MYLVQDCGSWGDFPCYSCPLEDKCFAIKLTDSFLSKKLQRAVRKGEIEKFIEFLNNDNVLIACGIFGIKINKIRKLLKVGVKNGWNFNVQGGYTKTGNVSVKILEDNVSNSFL